ncbi:MAG: hypothetical protein WA421_09105 [Nitrososphaeraceae archaeon]
MPNSRTSGRKSNVDTRFSTRTNYKKAHANAIKQYQDPKKRRGGKSQSADHYKVMI